MAAQHDEPKKKPSCTGVPFHWLNLFPPAGLDPGFWLEVVSLAKARGVRKEHRYGIKAICQEVYIRRYPMKAACLKLRGSKHETNS